MSIGGLSMTSLRKPGSIAEALKPLVQSFPYNYKELTQFFETYGEALTEFGAMCTRSLNGGCTNEELAEARDRLSAHELTLTLRYPDIGRVRGDADVLPDRIELVRIIPDSLTLYVNSRTHFQLVGHDESRRFTIVVHEDEKVFVEVDNHPE